MQNIRPKKLQFEKDVLAAINTVDKKRRSIIIEAAVEDITMAGREHSSKSINNFIISSNDGLAGRETRRRILHAAELNNVEKDYSDTKNECWQEKQPSQFNNSVSSLVSQFRAEKH
ncbi:hypothetical protein CDAR_86911 [Caerostris darwini]|uniref:Uncharacterized protein n=1 Tax=Caerostris darwini TaxID=1538125 RepID=A0AAV4V802_9ARAC|nr:hypothetical protein CDAR_86911 [Caerostris darwini]